MKLLTNPLQVKSFREMNLPEELLTALGKMNISKPTPIQSQAIPISLSGEDVIAVAQTGSGKTLAFALSLLTSLRIKSEARALILVPSREMAQQIYKVFLELCRELPVSVCLVVGGTAGDKQANQLKKLPKLIIATPGRLNDHLSTNKQLLQKVEIIVLDEADRMLDMGFAPQLRKIQDTIRGARQTLMFSASFGGNVEKIAELFMKPVVTMIRSEQAEAPVGTLKQTVSFIERDEKKERILDDLNASQGGVIIFTRDQVTCDWLFGHLTSYGYSVGHIHGSLTQGQRNRAMKAFREGELRILVSTDLLARGLDVPHVDHVVNFDLPFQSEDFLHRIGRTARAGRSGHALTYVTKSDGRRYLQIQKFIGKAQQIGTPFDFSKVKGRKK